MDPILKRIEAAGRAMNLGDVAILAAIAFAKDPHGIERVAAPAMLASALDVSISEANQAIIELLAKTILVETQGPTPRLEIDLAQVGLSPAETAALKLRRTPFVNHGAPHSDRAMASLAELFLNESGPIYLALEVTSPTVFKELIARARLARKTFFLMPRKRHVPSHRRRHYEEVQAEWRALFRNAEASVRKHSELRITQVPYSDLYTSGISAELARFDLRFLDARTTRDGEIIEVRGDTSLYSLVAARYSDALARSSPLWRIWWFRSILIWVRRIAFPMCLLVLALILVSKTNPYAAVTSTVALGLLANILFQRTGLDRWYQHKLFES